MNAGVKRLKKSKKYRLIHVNSAGGLNPLHHATVELTKIMVRGATSGSLTRKLSKPE